MKERICCFQRIERSLAWLGESEWSRVTKLRSWDPKKKGKPLEGFRRVTDIIWFVFKTVLTALWRIEWGEARMNTEDQWGDYCYKPGREDSSLGQGSNQGHGEKWKYLGYILNIGLTRLSSDTTEWLLFQFSLSCIGEGHGNPLQYSCLENPRDGGTWWAAVYGVAQSRTWLKWLSNSSSSIVKDVYPKSPNTYNFPLISRKM